MYSVGKAALLCKSSSAHAACCFEDQCLRAFWKKQCVSSPSQHDIINVLEFFLQSKDAEETYIPLLDVVDDTGDGNIKPADLQTLKLQSPTKSATSTEEPFVFKAQSADDAARPKTLPWSKASKKIKSPSLRLHHGKFLHE